MTPSLICPQELKKDQGLDLGDRGTARVREDSSAPTGRQGSPSLGVIGLLWGSCPESVSKILEHQSVSELSSL